MLDSSTQQTFRCSIVATFGIRLTKEQNHAVARASGVSIPDDLLAHILNIPSIMPNQTSSTAQDLARGKPSEIDFLNGYVVRKGAELGIPTPTNHALQVMVKLTERGKEMSARRT